MYYITAINRTESGTETVDVFAPHKSGEAAAEGTLKQEENKIDNLTLTIYPLNPAFGAVQPLVTRMDATDLKTGEVVFSGRVLTVEEGMDSEGRFYKTVTCEGALGYLCDSVYPYAKISAGTTPKEVLAVLINAHNRQNVGLTGSQGANIFHIAEDLPAAPALTEDIEGYRTTWEMVQDFLSQCGGVLRAVRDADPALYGSWMIDWTADSEAQAVSGGNAIELGENMLDVAKTFEFSGVCTRLYAFGKKNEDTGVRIGIGDVNGGVEYLVNETFEAEIGAAIYGVYTDDEAETPAALLEAARNELAARARAVESISSGAIDEVYLDMEERETFRVGQVYPLRCAPLGIDENVRVVARTVDINAPYKPTLTLGAAGPSMSGAVTAGSGSAAGGGAGVTYALSKDGNRIILTGSDGSTSSVTDETGTGGDGNTTYALSKSGNTIKLTGSDGSTSSVTDDDTTYDLSGYLPKAGGTMTGDLILSGDPTADNHAATKKYVDDAAVNVGVYATCNTGATAAAKVATIVSGTLELVTGARVTVRFENRNSVAGLTLNVGGTGAKEMRWENLTAYPTDQYWDAGAILDFVYTNNYWYLVGVAKDNDYRVKQDHITGDADRPLLLAANTKDSTSQKTGQTYYNKDIYGNPGTGTITSKYHALTETPTDDNHAATKKYVDDAVAAVETGGGSGGNYLPLAGGTVSGDLTVSGALVAYPSEGSAPAGSSFNVGDTLADLKSSKADTEDLNNYLPLTGGTITGDLRLKDSTAYGRTLYWGDGSYVYIKEPVDDIMELHSKSFRFTGQGTASANPLAVNQGGTEAVTADAARANLGAAAKWTVLWTNSSPSSSFAAQTVTISGLSGYNFFVIVGRYSTGDSGRFSEVAYIPETSSVSVFFNGTWQSGSGWHNVYRMISINRGENTVSFGGSKNNGSSGSDGAIPLYILGTKI